MSPPPKREIFASAGVGIEDSHKAGMLAPRAKRGQRAHSSGVTAERAVCQALGEQGWTILGQRVRTAAGEIDIIAELDGLLAIIEVKQRATLAGAAAQISARQRARLLHAAEIVLAAQPGWGVRGVRFDVIVVDAAFAMRRITDAFRLE